MIAMTFQVPRIGFGTAAIAGLYRPVSRSAAMETLEEAWSLGVRYFDTAPHYGQGKAERILGDFLRGKRAGDFLVSTKVGRLLSPAPAPHERLNGFVDPLPFDQSYDYSYDGIMRSFEDSLQRLGLHRTDILYIHDIGERTHGPGNARHMAQLMDGGFRALQELKESGTVAAFGIGVNEVGICERILDRADIDLILLAGRYTLLDRSAEAGLLKKCLETNTPLVIGGVFNSGILATGATPKAHWDYGQAPDHVFRKVEALSDLCEKAGITLPEAALAFPSRHNAVACILLGNGRPGRLAANIGAIRKAAVPDDFWLRSDKLVSETWEK